MAFTDSNNNLHPDQEPIHTSNVTRFAEQVGLLRNREHDIPELGVVIGPSGTGKTTAAQLYFTKEQKCSSTDASCMMIRVMPHMTPGWLLESITHQIDDMPRNTTRHVASQRALMALEQCQVRLLSLDEADNLRSEHLEVLRMLLSETTCSILLIGLPSLLTRIEKYRRLAARISFSLQFLPLPDEEMFTSFLPQLTLPGWVFNPKNETDLYMGEYLWRNTRPSLRRLFTILASASQIAQLRGTPTITLETIRLAVHMIAPQGDPSNTQSGEEDV
jgi:DNA transposition AAA+ family ATPase